MKDVIYNKRMALGLTQGQLAKKMGVSQAAISQYETGERVPSTYFVSRFFKKTGVCLICGGSVQEDQTNDPE